MIRCAFYLTVGFVLAGGALGCASVHGVPDAGGGGSGGSTETGGGGGGGSGGHGADAGPDTAPDTGGKLNEPCQGDPNLTGQEVLDALKFATEIKGVLRRYVYPPGPPATGQGTPFTMRPRYQGGAVICNLPGAAPQNGSNPNPAFPTVDVMLQVEFITEDGLFNETLTLPFQLRGTEVLLFKGAAPVSSIRGSYRAIAEADAAGPSEPVTFEGLVYLFMHDSTVGNVRHGDKAFAFLDVQ